MRATIRENVPAVRLAEAVPPRYREDVLKQISRQGTYTLVLCGHHPRDVNLSSQVARALKRIAPQAKERIIIVGAAFTKEARALAAEHGAQIIALHQTAWTDEAARQRQL